MKQAGGEEGTTHAEQRPLLEVDNIAVRYGPIQVLAGVSLAVNRSEIVALVGPNGAGKSSLMYGISGILPLSMGRIIFEEKIINGLAPEKIVKFGISFTTEGRMLFNRLTVIDNLKLGAYGRGIRHKTAIDRVLENVFQLFPILKERAKQMAMQLSGGEQQMLAIGRALMQQPKLLLLDEPSLGLAPILVREVMNSLAKLKEKGTAVLLSEQNVYAALNVADRGYVLGAMGKVILEGPQGELRGSETIRTTYLGVGKAGGLIPEQKWNIDG